MTNSKGIVLFAYNSTFDYVKIANVCAALAGRIVNSSVHVRTNPNQSRVLPVTLITDTFGALQADRNVIDNVIVHTSDDVNNRIVRGTHDKTTQTINWKNLTRADAYELSPYDQTLLLDCDYLMFNDNLTELFWTDIEFTCHKDAYDITGKDIFRGDKRLGTYSIPMLWATAVYFRKSTFSKSIFDMWKLVQDNYPYYAKVYGFKPTPFRNDFALSIAYHAMSGYGLDKLIPYSLMSLSPMTDVVDFRPNGELLYQYKNNKQQLCTGKMWNTDVHVMNKEIFTDEMCEALINYATDR